MSSNPNDLSVIRHVQPGDPVAAPVTSQPTRAIEVRLRALETAVLSMQASTTNNRLVIPNVPINSEPGQAVELYQTVYYNNALGWYDRALAGVTFQGDQFQANASSLALGVCVAVRSGGRGDIMVSGYYEWDASIRALMLVPGEIYRSGVPYYLTDQPEYAGRLTQYSPTLRVQVLSGTDLHFILQPEYGSPEVLENLSRVPVGARPVGSLRIDEASGQLARIVGFDGLEQLPNSTEWISTADSAVETLQNFGWLVADAKISQMPDGPLWIRIEVAPATDPISPSSIVAYSARSLRELTTGSGGQIFNHKNVGLLTPGMENHVQSYSVNSADAQPAVLGELSFRFTSSDTSARRFCVLQFPESFQGWKMVNPPVLPQGVVSVLTDKVGGVTLIEGGIGYLTPPRVTFDSPAVGVTAKGTAVLNALGSVVSVTIDDGGSGYTNATPQVHFDSAVSRAVVHNGGLDAVLTPILDGNGGISQIVVTNGGRDYFTAPYLGIYSGGTVAGYGASALAVINQGVITQVVVTNPGAGYTLPRVVVQPANNYGYVPSEAPVITAALSGGAVTTTFTYTSLGAGIVNGSAVEFVQAGADVGKTTITAATALVVVNPVTGIVSYVQLLTAGAGYTVAPTLRFVSRSPQLKISGGDPTSTAVGTVRLDSSSVILVDIKSRGAGYAATDVPVFTGVFVADAMDTIEAEGRLVVEEVTGRILDVILTIEGRGYAYPPVITITKANGTASTGYGFAAVSVMTAAVVSAKVTGNGGDYQAVPTAAVVTPLSKIDLLSRGTGYDIGTGILVSGGTASGGVISPAILEPELTSGILTGIKTIYAGANYGSAPTLTVVGTGTGATATATVANGRITAAIGAGGSGYTAAPAVTVDLPDPAVPTYGARATAVARVGAWVSAIRVTAAGSGQTVTPGQVPELRILDSTDRWHGGRALVGLVGGAVTFVTLIDPGYGYPPTGNKVVMSGVNGATATFEVDVEGAGQIARIDLLNAGWGYATPPAVTLAAPPATVYPTPASIQATAASALLGNGAKLSAEMYGWSGPLMKQTQLLNENGLQIFPWYLDASYQAGTSKPDAAWYYNSHMDPRLAQRYPPVPLDRAMFLLNGTEVSVTTMNSGMQPLDAKADLWLSSRLMYWAAPDMHSCPWDLHYRALVWAPGTAGVDHVVPFTGGLSGTDSDQWWRWRANTYQYQPQVNQNWMHINRASRYYTANRMSGLAVVSPLQLTDLITGQVLPNDGSPQTGVLGLQLAEQTSLFEGTSVTVNLAQANVLELLYRNEQYRPVYISSFLLLVNSQTNQRNQVAAVEAAARITIGTQAGSYQNMVGNYQPATPASSAVSTGLYGPGQIKELFPDKDFPSVLVQPGEAVYLRVTVPASSPITQQAVSVKVRGYFY